MWLPVVGHEGRYEVSDAGQVRSLDRVIVQRNGIDRPVRGKILKSGPMPSGHQHVVLEGKDDRTVHRLVLEAFVGPCPPGMEACHNNDIPSDNRLENLRWDTKSRNAFDAVGNGKHFQVNKTECKNGHTLSGDNLRVDSRGYRICRECARRRGRAYVDRRRG